MTDRELRHLSRKDLLEMLIEQEKENIRLREALTEAEEKLNSREIKLRKAGSLAEATLMLNGVFEAAEAAAKQYYEISNKPAEKEAVELVDSGWYIDSSGFHDGTVPVRYYGKILNPNMEYIAEAPALAAFLKDADGTVITESRAAGLHIMPDDTMAFVGVLEVQIDNVSESTQIMIQAESGEFIEKNEAEYPRMTDFPVEDPEEKAGRINTISGKVYNKTAEEADCIELLLILRKDEQVVYLDRTTVQSVKPKRFKGYKFVNEKEWPEHDDIEVVVIADSRLSDIEQNTL